MLEMKQSLGGEKLAWVCPPPKGRGGGRPRPMGEGGLKQFKMGSEIPAPPPVPAKGAGGAQEEGALCPAWGGPLGTELLIG